jgi:hypothetical protein
VALLDTIIIEGRDMKGNIEDKYAGYCKKHNKGPLDVWYDCDECSREEDRTNWVWLPILEILTLISPEDRDYWLRWWFS